MGKLTFFDEDEPQAPKPQPAPPAAPAPAPARYAGKTREWTDEELKDAARVMAAKGGKKRAERAAAAKLAQVGAPAN